MLYVFYHNEKYFQKNLQWIFHDAAFSFFLIFIYLFIIIIIIFGSIGSSLMLAGFL